MENMQFKCTLLSDLILSQDSSTEGNQYSLDFIPGNNFLGIVAGQIYDKVNALEVFHSGKVRFGDAHPSVNGQRGLKVPAALFHPKKESMTECCYVHHRIPSPENKEIKELQLKQCRKGFFAFETACATPISVDKNFAIKSAYDSEKRRSKDKMMFAYESLPKDLILYFEVASELDAAANAQIAAALTGDRHIGRSRTAQYGLVRIERADFSEISSSADTFSIDGNQFATVYADARLIFLDENGEPTFQPTAENLGFPAGSAIDWSKSQVRTFQYAPWNGKRNTADTDRCGIEKGSVFVVRCEKSPSESAYVGYYKNEGFGKVIYNPSFLASDENGKASCKFKEPESSASDKALAKDDIAEETPLLRFLKKQKDKEDRNQKLYESVNAFVNSYSRIFEGASFAAQWGTIRNIAMTTETEEGIREAVDEFLGHGIAKDKWEEQGRKEAIEQFMACSDNLRERLINLASEMAKQCKKEDRP